MAARDLKSYRHYPLKDAEAEMKAAMARRYRVTTINWTFATIDGQQDLKQVHRNVYSFTLEKLVKFIRDTEEVAEDIVMIEPEVK
jgi:hypothetical protein